MTALEIVLEWLERRARYTGQNRVVIRSSDIETRLPAYGEDRCGVMHTPSTYARRFRQARQEGHAAKRGLSVREVPIKNRDGSRSAESGWLIEITSDP